MNRRQQSNKERAEVRRPEIEDAVRQHKETVAQMERDKIYELSQTLHLNERAVRDIWHSC